MAISFVQSTVGKTASGTTVSTAAFGSSVTGGNTIMIGIANGSTGTSVITSITDSGSNTYTKAITSTTGSGSVFDIWYAVNVTGGSSFTVTANASGANEMQLFAQEFSGVISVGPLGPTAQGNSTTGTAMATSTFQAAGNDLIFAGGYKASGSATFTAGSGFSNLAQQTGTFVASAVESQIAPGGDSTAPMTASTSTGAWRQAASVMHGSITNLTFGSASGSITSQNTATVNATSNALLLLAVTSRTNITTNPNAPTVTGLGLTWTQTNTILYDSTSTSRKLLTVYQALGSPSSGAITMDFAGQVQTDVQWSLDQFIGVNTTTPIVQSATNKDETVTTNTLTVTLSSFASGSNMPYGAIAADNTGGLSSIGAGFLYLSDESSGSMNMVAEYKTTSNTTVTATFATNAMLGGIAAEVNFASSSSTPSYSTLMMMGV